MQQLFRYRNQSRAAPLGTAKNAERSACAASLNNPCVARRMVHARRFRALAAGLLADGKMYRPAMKIAGCAGLLRRASR
jgi:hypothetical protein